MIKHTPVVVYAVVVNALFVVYHTLLVDLLVYSERCLCFLLFIPNVVEVFKVEKVFGRWPHFRVILKHRGQDIDQGLRARRKMLSNIVIFVLIKNILDGLMIS